jgi:repressor LexA
MNLVTEKQKRVLDFIRDEIGKKQCPPSIREIVAHFGYRSTKAASDHLAALERKGYISREKGNARSIRLADNERRYDSAITGIPLVGCIPAGIPEGREQIFGRTMHIDAQTLGFVPSRRVFALTVRGDSMINRGIFDGDTAIIDAGQPAKDGDVVVALIDNESTLKTLVSKNNGTTYLQSENPSYSNLVPISELVIQGVARAIIRNLA